MCDVLLSTKEAADLLRVSEARIRQLIKRGELPGADLLYDSDKVGWHVPSGAVEAFAAKHNSTLHGEVRARIRGIRAARGMIGCDAS
jgi:hypothetical protein